MLQLFCFLKRTSSWPRHRVAERYKGTEVSAGEIGAEQLTDAQVAAPISFQTGKSRCTGNCPYWEKSGQSEPTSPWLGATQNAKCKQICRRSIFFNYLLYVEAPLKGIILHVHTICILLKL